MTRCDLDGTQVRTDGGEVASELPRMLHPVLPNLLNNGAFHLLTSKSSSGEQISGHWYPSLSTMCLTMMRVNGLFRWAKFHVMTTSIPFTAATAT